MTLKSRITTQENRDGSRQIVVLDPHSGQVVANYKTANKHTAHADVKQIKENLERHGHHTDVIEQRR